MTLEDTIRVQLVAALQSPEGREAIRDALRGAMPEPAPAKRDPEQRLSVKEAAEHADKHADTLLRAIRGKKLRAFKPDGSREWLIRWADLELYLNGGTAIRPVKQIDPVDERRKVADAVARARRVG